MTTDQPEQSQPTHAHYATPTPNMRQAPQRDKTLSSFSLSLAACNGRYAKLLFTVSFGNTKREAQGKDRTNWAHTCTDMVRQRNNNLYWYPPHQKKQKSERTKKRPDGDEKEHEEQEGFFFYAR